MLGKVELATKKKAQSDSEEAANIARREKERAYADAFDRDHAQAELEAGGSLPGGPWAARGRRRPQ